MLPTCLEHSSYIIKTGIAISNVDGTGYKSVTYHFGVTVNLTLTSGLSSNNRALSISPILFDVEISNFVCGRTLVLFVVAYYFGVTLSLTLTSVLFKSCTEHIS